MIKQIHPISYNYTGEADMPTNERFIGTFAQELQKIAPYMVHTWTYNNERDAPKDYLAIDYNALSFMLINAVKEQQTTIEQQNTRIDALEKLLAENTTTTTANQIEVSYKTAQLFQNEPNPFDAETKISFILPPNVSDASIVITDLQGKMVQDIKVSGVGKQEITLQAATLSKGIYLYSLNINGQILDTKKMLLQ